MALRSRNREEDASGSADHAVVGRIVRHGLKSNSALRMALAFITAGLGAASATPNRPTLALQPGIGLSITGSTGVLYSIEYTTNLSQPNWRTLALVTLSSPSALVPGTAPVAAGSRFYRAKSVTVTQTNMVYMSQGTFLMG